MKNPPLLFLDVETTGHDPLRRVRNSLVTWHEIIEIGAIAATGGTLQIFGSFETKVKPEHPERCLPALINGYQERARQGEWHNAPSLGHAIFSFLSFCRKINPGPFILAGQNISFDWSFLSVAFAECGLHEDRFASAEYFHYARLDTRSMAVQKFCGEEGYDPDDFSLRAGLLQKRLDIKPEPLPHTALNGAMQAYELYKALQKKPRS